MSYKYEHLLSPITVGNITFRNRIFSAPMGLHALQRGEKYVNEAVITHYANKAKGGAALVTAAGVNVERGDEIFDGVHAHYSPYTNVGKRSLIELAQRIHYYGAVASMEIGHKFGSPYAVVAGLPRMMSAGVTEQMPTEEMERLAEAYGDGAAALRDLGFDMCMVHIGHGGVVGQFLSPYVNTRKDDFGDSSENRVRFPNMIFDSIKKKAGRDFLIELRFSGSEVDPKGYSIDDALEFVPLLEDHVDILHVSCGICNARYFTTTHPSGFLPPEPNVQFAEAIKKSGTKLPVAAIGAIQDLNSAEKIIADGRADIVAIARGLIADPELSKKAYAGKGEDVRPCIKCYHCHDGACYYDHFVCSVNPEIGREDKLSAIVPPLSKPQKVAVVGGGPAGMQAALYAAKRGHDVTLYEKSDRLGGQLNFADYASFKYDMKKYKNYLINQVAKSSVKVNYGITVTQELLAFENPEWIIAAIGASPMIIPIKGIENVVLAPDVYGNEGTIGKKVVVVGGGQVGIETGLYLTDQGCDVIILEMKEKLAPDAWFTYKWALDVELNERENISWVTKARCSEITRDSVNYIDENGKEEKITADTIVLAAGMKAKLAEANELYVPGVRFIAIGDCHKVGNVEAATREAFDAVMNL